MAIEVERLIATLEANFNKYDRALNKALGNTNSTFTRIESRGKQLESRLSKVGGGFGKLTAALGVGVSLRGAEQLVDTATRIQNALKIAGLSGSELASVYDRLYASAQKNAAPLEGLAVLYGRVASAQSELGVTSAQILTLTDNVAKAVRLTGGSAEEASGALLQLSQALGGGKIQAEEYNSLIDGLRPLLQSAAAGIAEAGGSVAKLTQLVKAGKVSSKAFFDGINAGAPLLDEKLGSSVLTISQRFVRLQNVLVDAAGRFDAASKASSSFGGGIDALSSYLANVDMANLIQQLDQVINTLSAAEQGIYSFAEAVGKDLGLNKIGDFILENGGRKIGLTGLDDITNRIGTTKPTGNSPEMQAFIDKNYGGQKPLEVTVSKPVVKPVSLADYPVSGSGSGKAKKTRQNDYQREVEQITKRTSALQAETAAQAGLNPLVSDYGFAVEKARAVQDLLNAAQEAGLIKTADLSAATPELRTAILSLADGMATATAASERLQERQDILKQSAEDLRDFGKEILGGFISDLREGKSATEALSGALDKVADKLLDLALNSLFGAGGAGGGLGGFFASILPGILHSGGVAGQDGYGHGRAVSSGTFASARRYHRGGVAGLQPGEVPAILQRGEVVLPRNAGVGGSQRGAPSIHVTVGVSADNNGNLMPFVQRVADSRAQNITAKGITAYDRGQQRRQLTTG